MAFLGCRRFGEGGVLSLQICREKDRHPQHWEDVHHIDGWSLSIALLRSIFEGKDAIWSSPGSFSGKMTVGHASLGKAWTSRKAQEVVSLGRELLGGNGILADFLVAKAFCDLEPIFSYEGTYDINSLVTGREITWIASFKPSALAKARL
ncbi:hypothetical protein ABZP36_028705 [Zizania latifolia]